METQPREENLSALTFQELGVMRWNAFLERDYSTLERVRREALGRTQVAKPDPMYLELESGCVKDLDKLAVDLG